MLGLVFRVCPYWKGGYYHLHVPTLSFTSVLPTLVSTTDRALVSYCVIRISWPGLAPSNQQEG